MVGQNLHMYSRSYKLLDVLHSTYARREMHTIFGCLAAARVGRQADACLRRYERCDKCKRCSRVPCWRRVQSRLMTQAGALLLSIHRDSGNTGNIWHTSKRQRRICRHAPPRQLGAPPLSREGESVIDGREKRPKICRCSTRACS